MIVTGAITFVSTFVIAAPYGKFSASKGWGFLLPANIAWMLMETPNLWMSGLILFASLEGPGIEGLETSNLPIFSLNNQVLLGMFLLHYFNRSIIFPITMPEGNPMPVTVMLLAFFYCSWNGFNQAVSLIIVSNYPSNWYQSPQFLLGVSLFFIGFATNIYSDRVLFGLKEKAKAQGVQYVIPEGGLFNYVSCANYCKYCQQLLLHPSDWSFSVGEVLEWTGFAIACNSLPALAFAWYTFSNLYPRAYAVSLSLILWLFPL